MLFIHPDECIDCEACVPECPPLAIFHQDDLPEQWADYTALNAEMSANCPQITELLDPMGPPIQMDRPRRRGHGRHFVAYHNTPKMGREFGRKGSEEWGHLTRKPSEHAIGGLVWHVSGTGNPRRYLLHGYTQTTDVEPSDDPDFLYEVFGDVIDEFDPPILLNELSWFPSFLKSQNNFSLGLQSITAEFVEHLEALIPDEADDPDIAGGNPPVAQWEISAAASQGISISAEDRMLIERHAIGMADHHFKTRGYRVEHFGKPFDLKCTKRGSVKFVEVKGTSTLGESVFLTPNEVDFARQNQSSMALFIVRSIELVEIGGEKKAIGGVVRLFDPWNVDAQGNLAPDGFIYTPGEETGD